MPLKSLLKPYHLMVDGNMGGSLTSAVFDVSYTDNVGIQLTWTSTAVGVFSVEGSIDYDDTAASGNWSALTFTVTPEALGTASTHLLNLSNIPYKKLRVKYTRTSSSGTLQVWVMAKSLGS